MARAREVQNDASLTPAIARLLRDRAASTLSDDDLLVFAACLEQRPVLVPLRMASLLQQHGFAHANPSLLAARLHRAASKVRGLVRFGDLVGVDDWRVIQQRALSTLRRGELRALSAPAAMERKRPPSTTRSTAAPEPIAKAQAPIFEVPPTLPLGAPPVTWGELDTSGLALVMAKASADVGAVSIAMRAHQLATAEEFQELLSPASLIGVVSHVYQLETVRRVVRVLRGRALLADEVGLGKTVEAMMILREYQLRGMVRRALILAPPALVRQWAGELAVKASVLARTTEDPLFREDPERFWNSEGVIVASLSTARTSRHAKVVSAVDWDIVVVDEAHHIKNRQALAWKLVNELRSRFLLLLTATPIETDLEEIYNLVTLLRPGQLTTPAAFRAQFVDPKDPTAPRNHEILRRLLAEVMVRNTRAQSGLMLPPRFVTTVTVEPSAPERELYDDVVQTLRAHAEGGAVRLLASTLLLEAGSSVRAVQGTLARALDSSHHPAELKRRLRALHVRAETVTTSSKTERLIAIVQAANAPVLVFTRFRETLAHLAEALHHAGLECVSFQGGQSAAAKEEALTRFRAGARVMVATDVGAEGQNMQFCHVLVNYDLPWNPMLLEQRIGRLHRMGQTHEVMAYNLCAKGTVEERVLDVLDRRLHLFELVVGEMDMVLGNLADERDLEERILHIYATTRSDAEVDRGFDAIAAELAAARAGYERTRDLDEKLFRRDFEA